MTRRRPLGFAAGVRFLVPLLLLPVAPAAELTVAESPASIEIRRDNTPVVVYHKTEMPPPEGVGERFRRSGFIHPLTTPSGETLTGIHPSDHYHHVGLFHAWVKTRHGEDTPDFWNIGNGTGRVRYAETAERLRPRGFTVLQDHVSYPQPDREGEVVLRERLAVDLRIEDDCHLIDYLVVQTNVTDTALELPVHRYGGPLAWRGPHDWDKDNSSILTSEGHGRDDSHTTRAKWVAFHGPTDPGRATFAVLISPANRDFPQRLRTWGSKTHDGAPFLSIVPTQETAWSIPPGRTIAESYRIVTADRELAADELDQLWQDFAGDEEA